MNIEDNYMCSLLAKPFVILTGGSGTGKTRLAIQFSEAINKKSLNGYTLELKIDKNGKILNKSEEDIKALCEESNLFEAIVLNDDGKKYPIKITMCTHVESENVTFTHLISLNNETIINISRLTSQNNEDKNYELVPVGADWTDVRYLLGYTNPFGDDGKKIYEITDTLKIILRALHPENKYKPYFLILDEMNLSHVERYFSTFLSVMEANRSTNESIMLISKKELELINRSLGENSELKIEFEATKDLLTRNKGIYLPQNLFIIGTINVDETTYMFSPKVLDRAHVIELNTQNPINYFNQLKLGKSITKIHFDSNRVDQILMNFKKSIKNRSSEYENSLELLKESFTDITKQSEVLDGIEKIIEGIYVLLEPCGFGYGYRIVNEVLEYIKYSIDVLGSNLWVEILDTAILQKILPKIHGNRRQLGDCLKALVIFLDGQASNYEYGNKIINTKATGIKLIKCKQKIEGMIENLNYTGYTSFIS
ncbi:hypothetical protein FDB73_12930 [Clostridium botulinum]|nr:hypothetical protein [Clostridium botulinum]NFP54148.1 hypothetical protein [Clostridium botulinum]NFT11363.1 hypothetical protein [Clostridium botulinum]NFT62522.1 hypothetical protein [Clostridium botulinum]